MQDLPKNRAISDIYLVSALIAYGLRPLRIDRSQAKRQKFIFDCDVPVKVLINNEGNSTEDLCQTLCLNEIETHFLSKTLLFPGNYPETLREIRATIHAYVEDNNS